VSRGVRYLKLLGWIFESFGPLLSFWIVLKTRGLVPAIIVGVAVGALLVVKEIWKTRKVSPFTAYSAIMVALFGYLDLKYQSGFWIKLEPAVGNVATGIFFLATVFLRRPIIIEFAERQAGRSLAHRRKYLTIWTLLWSLFFFLRASAFVWMAYNLTLDDAVLLRMIAGPIAFGMMFVIERITRWLVYGWNDPDEAPVAAQSEAKPALIPASSNHNNPST
jgi:intracellular septation protein A